MRRNRDSIDGVTGTRLRRGVLGAGVALATALLAVAAVGHVVNADDRRGELREIVGTSGPDRLYGTVRADRIDGLGGADKLVGRGGGDVIDGGPGADKLRGGKGDDRLIAGAAGAVMIGGQGRDEFNMDAGEQIDAPGRDVIWAQDGTPDEINCGDGNRDIAYVDPEEDGIYDCERVRVAKEKKR